MWLVPKCYKLGQSSSGIDDPCGGGVEYLHRDPASRKRRRKGKFRIWDSKIWPRVLRDSDPKMTALAKASRNCKRQTRPLVRDGNQDQQTRNCQTIIKIWSWAPEGCFIPRQTGRLTVGRKIRLKTHSGVELSSVQLSEVTWSSWLVSGRVQLAVQLKVSVCRED
jgi:hypothetical protein